MKSEEILSGGGSHLHKKSFLICHESDTPLLPLVAKDKMDPQLAPVSAKI